MTVRQLIQELLALDLDSEVMLEVGGDGANHTSWVTCIVNDCDKKRVTLEGHGV